MHKARIIFVYMGILASFAGVFLLASAALLLGGIDSSAHKGERVSVRVDLKALDSFTEEEISSFRTYLMRDARWRVFKQNRTFHSADTDSITASLRNNRYGIWLEDENVQYADGDNPDELKVEIHFGFSSIHKKYLYGVPQRMVVTKTSFESATLTPYQKEYHLNDERFVSELVIERQGLVIHLTETSRDGEKNLTARFLEYLRSTTASLKEKGIRNTELSADSRKGATARECVFVGTTRALNSIAVRGWLNPAEPGTITLEARGIMSGKKVANWFSSKENTGWSADPTERFYFAFWLPGTSRLEPEQYRYVLHFTPASGGKERIIAECAASEKENYTYRSALEMDRE